MEMVQQEERPIVQRRKALLIIAAVTASAAVLAVVLCGVLLSKPRKEALVGTWETTLPVGEALCVLLGGEETGNGTLASILREAGADMAVTVYCRFYENDTYSVYVGHEELLSAWQQTLDAIIAYACDDGLFAVLETQGISRPEAELFLAMGNIPLDSIAESVSVKLQELLAPVYQKVTEWLTPADTQMGERAYLLEDDRLYMALETGKPIEESVYVVCGFDGETVTFQTGTFLDEYLTDLTFTRSAA